MVERLGVLYIGAHPTAPCTCTERAPTTWASLKHSEDGWITFACLNEFRKGDLAITILVVHAEEFVNALLRCTFVFRDSHNIANHFVYGSHNFKHFLSADVPIRIQIIHGKGPLQLLLHRSAGCHGKATDELSEINAPVTVCIKRAKYVLRKLAGVAIRKKVTVYFLEFFHSEGTVGAILQKAFIPFLQFLRTELGLAHQIRYHLRLEFAVLLSHFV
mmetsp:Transcript_72432/g.121624  ORF Transcript_72432/g.121624 Transcript_72432/m.121624 type:complete len:217 (-) Transcript_72432:14-664(-)